MSNRLVLQQSSIPIHEHDESNSILQNIADSAQRIQTAGSPPRGPVQPSISDKISIQNPRNITAGHTPQGLMVKSVTPIISKHNRRRFEDVELIKEASMEVSNCKASQQILNQRPKEDVKDKQMQEESLSEPIQNF